MATLVSGLFSSPTNAQHAVDELLKFGFAREDIRLPFSDSPDEAAPDDREPSRAPLIAGALIGGVLGALAAGVAAAGTTSADVPLLAAGPLAVALTGFSAGAAAGGVTGALVGRGNPDPSPSHDDGPQPPGTRIGVRVHDGRTRLVRYVLGTCGAEQITN